MSTPMLELHDRVPERVLATVAHPDDLEYGAAALVARWTRAGAAVVYVLATRGESGIDGMAPAEAARVRTKEQVASAAVVGVSTVEFLDHADGTVELGLPLRRDLAVGVREALVCGSPLATHAADVTDTVDLAVASPAEHRAYLEGLGEHPMTDPEVLRDWLELAGRQAQGRGAAVTFELFCF